MSYQISIIVPVYNAEKYLEKCLNSLKNQTYPQIEILLINDGSTDNSKNICKDYCNKDKRFILIEQQNSGVSAARNKGMEKATGDYIMFLDSDDYLELNTVEAIVEIIRNNKVDIVKFSIYKKIGKIRKKYKFNSPVNQLIERKDYEKLIYPHILVGSDFNNTNFAINKKFLTKNNLYYDNQRKYGEEYLFIINSLFRSKAIYFLEDYLYHYTINPTSAMHNYNRKSLLQRVSDEIEVHIVVNEMMKKAKNEDCYKRLCLALNDSIKLIAINENYENYKKLLTKIKFSQSYQYFEHYFKSESFYQFNLDLLLNKKTYQKLKRKTKIKNTIRKIMYLLFK